MKDFDLRQQSLDPAATLIEASAGTGKTYNIQHLYLRFILEEGLTPDRILVVTFSREATAELKMRITANLTRAENLLLSWHACAAAETPEKTADPELSRILLQALKIEKPAEVLRRVQFAVRAMDEAAILTIHGFCLSVLTDYAFESGALFGVELVADRRQLLGDLLSDFVQREVASRNDITGILLREYLRLDALQEVAVLIYGKDDIVPLGEAEIPDIMQLFSSLLFEDLPGLRKELAGKRGKKAYVLLDYLAAHRQAGLEEALGFVRLVNSEEVTGIIGRKYYQTVFPPQFQEVIRQFREIPGLIARAGCLGFVEYLREHYEQAADPFERSELLFDDLLYLTRKVLKTSGQRLVRRVREDYAAVMVDEFQDTSGVQFEVFNTLFGGGMVPFFMIGDPKQSIYAFRGADIFSYLQAVSSPGVDRVTLRQNFRSVPEYIAALNLFFANRRSADGKALPFIFEEITYIEITAGRTDNRRLAGIGAGAPLEIRWQDSAEELSVATAEREIIRSVADDIAGKLNLAADSALYFSGDEGESAVKPSDFAVLVEKNMQGELMRRELNRRGIVGVLLKSGSVFESVETQELVLLLRAILAGGAEQDTLTALTARCFSYSVLELEQLRTSGSRILDYWSEFFAELKQVLVNLGFLPAFALFFAREHKQVAHPCAKALLAAGEDGERAVTNYLQLVEILEQEIIARSEADTAVLEILEELILARSGNEDYEMRLESDEDAVKIMTIHKSKGLEFPVVYVPFMYGAVRDRKRFIRPLTCHLDSGSMGLILSATELQEQRAQLEEEERAERLRLLYVALTRAVDKCIIYGGRIKGIERSALADIFEKDFSRLESLAQSEYITLEDGWSDQGRVYRSEVQPAELQSRKFSGYIERDWGVMSYSSLVSHDFKRLDMRSDIVPLPDSEIAVTNGITDNMRLLPSSNMVGSAVHEILEQVSFGSTDHGLSDAVILQELQKYRIVQIEGTDSSGVAEVATIRRLLALVCGVPLRDNLGREFNLGMVTRKNYMAEMSFYFPVRAKISTERLYRFFQERGLAGYRQQDTLREVLAGIGLSLEQKGFREGFLYGLIDLTFEYAGRYYFIDWKTNNLARYGGYTPGAVLRSMGESGYLLQFYIYTVALTLLLSSRIPEFDYSRDFGGGFYLYLRGLEQENPEQGVFYDVPSAADVQELIDIFSGGNI